MSSLNLEVTQLNRKQIEWSKYRFYGSEEMKNPEAVPLTSQLLVKHYR